MNRSVACLRSYLAAWWMKLIAAAVAVGAVNAVVFLEPVTIWEPAWPHPLLVSSSAIEAGIPPDDPAEIEGLIAETNVFRQSDDEIRRLLRQLPGLRYCRIDVPRDQPDTPQAAALKQAVGVFFDELQRLPDLEAIELTGRTSVAVLQHLRGSQQIRHLYTSPLYANDASRAADWFASLVDAVAELPMLETWGLPADVGQRLSVVDPQRLQSLREHPSLHTLLVPPQGGAWPDARLLCHKILPGMHLATSDVNRGRLSLAWGILAVTMFVAGLVVVSVAGMLVVSSAVIVPDYARTHRRVVAGLLAVISAIAATCLFRVNVEPLPAVVWAAVSVLIPAATLEWDRRRSMPGILVLPMSLAWCLAFIVPLSIIGRGWWWVWLDRFLETNLPTPTTWAMLLVDTMLAVVWWQAMARYTVSLAGQGRTSVVTATRLDVWQQLPRVGGLSTTPGGSLWGSGPVCASRAVRFGRLSSCDTAAGRSRLLAEGMMTIPLGRLLVQAAIIAVGTPLVMSITVPAFRAHPQLMVTALGAIALACVWMGPLVLWNERAARLPGEVASLLPRQVYVAAMRRLLNWQMLLPMFALFAGAAVVILRNHGLWWTLTPLAGVTVAMAVISMSVTELLLTMRSAVLKFLVAFGLGYPAVIAGGAAIVVLLNAAEAWATDGWLRLLPFAIVATSAVALRVWLNRRMQRFEFGRLV